MKYHFDATEDFLKRQNEIQILLETAEEKNDDRKDTFLKLAVVSLVTKFQVYVESSLKEFLYLIRSNGVRYEKLPLYMKLNSIKIDVGNNALINLAKHNKFNEDTKNKITEYISSISYIMEEEQFVNENLKLRTNFPLGRTGKDELLELFEQIKGEKNIFLNENSEENIDLNQLDALLLTRHLIIHQDRFSQTETTIRDYQNYLYELVEYCDNYLYRCLEEYGIQLQEKVAALTVHEVEKVDKAT